MSRTADARAILIAGPTASGKSGLGAGAGRAARRRRHQCRQHAGLPRAGHPDGAADGRGRRRAPRTPFTASSAARRPIPPAAMRSMRPARSPRRAGRAACPSSSAAPGFTSRRCWKVCRRCRPPIRTCAPIGARRPRSGPAPELHAMLAARDPEMAARLMPTDPQRIVRALEVLESTGRSLADWQRQPGQPVLAERARPCAARAAATGELTARAIDARFDAMLAAGRPRGGARGLLALGLVRRAADHAGARGGAAGRAPRAASCSLEAACAAAKPQTRQYAKRQLTWLRRNMILGIAIDTQQMERIDRDNLGVY